MGLFLIVGTAVFVIILIGIAEVLHHTFKMKKEEESMKEYAPDWRAHRFHELTCLEDG